MAGPNRRNLRGLPRSRPRGTADATADIFVPALGFVLVLSPMVRRLRQSATTFSFLGAFDTLAVGLMCLVVVNLAGAALTP